MPGRVKEICVVEPGHALAGSGSVSAANVTTGSLGFVGGQELMKPDAIVKTWLRPRGVCVSQQRQRVGLGQHQPGAQLTSNGPLHALPFLIAESTHAEWRASVESTVAAARR